MEYNELKTLVITLSEKVLNQEKEIKTLTEKINLLKNGHKSNTSSTPPSHDIGRSNIKNLRIKTGRNSGGQTGHKGSYLEMKTVPDEVIDYIPNYCKCCGTDLQNETSEINECKQEVIIPPIQVRYIEHRSHTKTCKNCGTVCTADLPSQLKAPIQYGPSVAAAVSYLSVYQQIPYKRITQLFEDMFNLPISEGTVDNMLEDCMQKALPIYNQIQQELAQSEVVGSDETGCRIKGKKGWMHTWQNIYLTFIAASMNRGYATIEKYFPKGFIKATLVSDCWAAQLKTPALLHQLCLVHLIRELSNFIDALSCEWSKEMKLILQQAIALKHQLKEEDYAAFGKKNPQVAILEDRLDKLLQADLTNQHNKVQAFQKRLINKRDSIFTFLYYPDVPADNNGSERAFRNVKVKTKVSGQFRTENGAKRFAVLRSVIDTTIKNSQNVYQALVALANLRPT